MFITFVHSILSHFYQLQNHTPLPKNAVIWNLTSSGSCKNRCFGGTYRLRHQSDNTLKWWQYVPPIRRFLQEPDSVTSQNTVFFMVTAVEASNLPHSTLFTNHIDTILPSAIAFSSGTVRFCFFAYFHCFVETKFGLWDLHAFSMSAYPNPITFCMHEAAFMRNDVHIVALDTISSTYYINPSHQCESKWPTAASQRQFTNNYCYNK
jgi:hypothetical protein